MTKNVHQLVKMTVFQNPMNLPLEKVELVIQENGIPQVIPALSKRWVDRRYFLRYEIPYIYHENGQEIVGSKDRWMEVMNYLANDYDWLIKLPFYKFWSNIVYDRTIMDSLVSVLQDSPTSYNFDKFPKIEEMHKSLENVRRKVLIVFARIVTSKASASEFFEREYHGNLLYDHFLISVPIILDLCQLYGRENTKIVSKIISRAVKLQPLYKDDFTAAAQFSSDVLMSIEQRYVSRPIVSANGVIRITEKSHEDCEITIQEIEDVIIYLTDISSNLSIFLTVYAPAIEFFGNNYLLTRIVSTYGSVLPEIYKKLYKLGCNNENMVTYVELKHLLDVTRMEFISIFRTAIFKDIAGLLEQSNPSEVGNVKHIIDRFVNFLTIAVSDKDFMIDYNSLYSIEEDLDLLYQISPEVDPVKVNFLKCSVTQEVRGNDSRKKASIVKSTPTIADSAPDSTAFREVEPVAGSSSTADVSLEEDKSQVALWSLISNVKDVMCDLGEGFIERCLKYYNNKTESVINAILEDSLPPELKELDRNLPYIPPDDMDASAAVDKSLGMERLNIFDGDEFDVMTRDKIDISKVHRGKRKDKYRNFNDLLNDKSFKQDVAGIYDKYGIVEDEYDDEYDDTYESQDVGVRGSDDPLEMDAKLFTTPRVLCVNEKYEGSAIDEDEEEVESIVPNGRDRFCQDPAVLRARAEQRRFSKQNAKSHHGGDVVGRAKGQGNTKEVLVNRDKKNMNKATRGNHSRRTGAEWKRRQGMVPS